MKKWIIKEDETIADIQIEVFGKDEKELFENISDAFTSVITSPGKLSAAKEVSLKLAAKNIPELVFLFTEKLIYLKDVKQVLFKKGVFQCMFTQKGWTLYGLLSGQKIAEDLPTKIDIKAITRHKFSVVKNGYYKATLVFDL
ncbi:archease [Candidatus Roizmanbacteria bacterium]|nr:archease [Candidatus Roizmanbacteria bacterium]